MSGLDVGVIFGGRSVEHDVSIVTAHQLMDVLAGRHHVVPIYITKDGRWFSAPGLHDLDVYKNGRWEELGRRAILPPVRSSGLLVEGGRFRALKKVALDVVVPAIHGTNGEDGTLQGLLELADLPYAGSGVAASAVGMDKVAMKAAFVAAGLPVVPHVVVESERLDDGSDVIDEIESAIGYPAFAKPARLGSSVGIGKASNREKLIEVLEVARRYDRRILVERAVEDCAEINCSVLGGAGFTARASVCEQPVPWEEFLSFDDKYLRGGKGSKGEGMAALQRQIPAPISAELTERVRGNALAAFAAVDASGVARVDSFVNEQTGDIWVMEINTTPGSFSFYLWEHSGMSFEELAQALIDIALETHRRKGELLFSFESGMLDGSRGAKAGG